ncbi:hypothetical protein BDR07DRAFT_1609051 [Suillus spraguei]|nr:hypothetical protein BDR07DRAFT_1609051 [Suillus spraguei]
MRSANKPRGGPLLCIDCALYPRSSPSTDTPVKHSLASFSPPPSSQHKKMASQLSQQYAFRAQKSMGLVNGTPTYMPIEGFAVPDVPARTYHYSPDGRLFAYALPTVVRIFLAEGAQLLQELSVPNIIELKFSPRGTYLSTWERPVKLEDGAQHKNLRVFSASTGEDFTSFTQRTGTFTRFSRFRSPSPGLNLSVAVFVAEKKGASAVVKADHAQIKWNDLGTQVFVLTQMEVDNSNMNYYGETIVLEVITLHDFGSSPHNFISFNPQGRLVALAGFGRPRRQENADEDLYYRRTKHVSLRAVTLRRVSFDSYPVSSVFPVEELYQASWGPIPLDQAPQFGSTIPAAPQPSISILIVALTAKYVIPKPVRAYRPPDTRGFAMLAISSART